MTETTPDSQSENTEPERQDPVPTEPGTVTDEQLPEDLRPTDDNPLAQPLDEDDRDSGMQVGSQDPAAGS